MARAADVLATLRSLPFADYDAITGGKPVLVLAPHADDESCGCGGLIAEACERGRPIAVAVLTDGTGSHPHSRTYPPARLRAVRESEARAAVAALGLVPERIHFLGLPDTASPHEGPAFAHAADRIARLAREYSAGTLCATWVQDPHGDHVSAYRLAKAVCQETGARLLAYPVWAWTLPDEHGLPDAPVRGYRLDIARHLPAKRRAITCHRSQTTDLIADDPSGFRMPPAFRALFDAPYEAFIRDQAG
jgi:LmbE family N-acetylglucosaminyl deacetylase